MTNNHATPEEIARLRSDIATIQSAMDDSLPFTRTDIRFSWAFLAALGVCLVMELLGWCEGVSRLLAMTPALIPASAHLVYQWRKSRAASETKPAVKKDYRFAIIAGPLLLVALTALRKWGKSFSISEQTFSGISGSLVGLILVIASFYGSSSLSRYHRVSLRYSGIMIALVGFIFPYLRQESMYAAVYIFFIVALVPYILWLQVLLKKQEISDGSAANAL
jgi:hypothetical protein